MCADIRKIQFMLVIGLMAIAILSGCTLPDGQTYVLSRTESSETPGQPKEPVLPQLNLAVVDFASGAIQVGNPQTRELIATLLPDQEQSFLNTLSVSISPDGKTLLTIREDGTVNFWDVKTGEFLKAIELGVELGQSHVLDGISFTSDGETVLVTIGDLGPTGNGGSEGGSFFNEPAPTPGP